MTNNTFTLLTVFILLFAAPVFAQTRSIQVRDVVRVKGQESTTIYGWGIVSGLPGTGDDPKAYTPAARAILRELARTGMFGADEKGVSTTKNNALVNIMVTIPANGARDGDTLDCTITAIGNAKNLTGGVLSPAILGTALQQDENSVVLGMAQGSITIEQTATPTRGRIVNGCRLLADFTNPYIKDGMVTLVIKPELAHPKLANAIAAAINSHPEFGMLPFKPAKAINSNYVVVRMSMTDHAADPLDFIERILDAEIMEPPVAVPRVTINERTGIIAVDENVEVRPTAVTYGGFVAEMPPALAPGEMEQFPRQFIDVDTNTKFRQMSGEAVNNVKLKALMASLDALRATPQQTIEIIKVLHKQGAIIGDVVFVD